MTNNLDDEEYQRFNADPDEACKDPLLVFRIKNDLAIRELIQSTPCFDEYFEIDRHDQTRWAENGVSLTSLLASRQNLFICGEAGAGKSTALLAYVEELQGSNDIVLFFPLSELVRYMSNSPSAENLIEAIRRKIEESKTWVTYDALKAEFSKGKCRLLLDALDEAIVSLPVLADCIRNLSIQFPNLQIVVTSRDIGRYSASICFLPILLRRFSKKQLTMFLGAYLKGRVDSSRLKLIRKHVMNEPKLNAVVRTPLLAAVLCEIACVRNDLPRTEVTLYEDRIRLLAGELDALKRIQPRTSFLTRDLQLACQKVAMHFHQNNSRWDDLCVINRVVPEQCGFVGSSDTLQKLVRDLVAPCQLLVPMDEHGNYGFGHLRFQEYLVGYEMQSWGMEKFRKLVSEVWWHGPIRLWALIKGDISEFFTQFPYTVQSRIAKQLQLEILAAMTPIARRSILENMRASGVFGDRKIIEELSKKLEDLKPDGYT